MHPNVNYLGSMQYQNTLNAWQCFKYQNFKFKSFPCIIHCDFQSLVSLPHLCIYFLVLMFIDLITLMQEYWGLWLITVKCYIEIWIQIKKTNKFENKRETYTSKYFSWYLMESAWMAIYYNYMIYECEIESRFNVFWTYLNGFIIVCNFNIA